MLHGAIVWLLSVPVMLAFGALGAAGLFGDWYGGMSGTPWRYAIRPAACWAACACS